MKNLLSAVLAMSLIFIMGTTAFATNNVESNNAIWAVINSEGTKATIADNIDFNKLGKQTVSLGNDISFEYNSSESNEIRLRAYSLKSGTMSGRFYLTSSDQTVATYSLAVTFRYNGTSVYANDDDIQISHSAIPNWSIDGDYSKSSGSGWISVDASYQLYHDGNYNNDTFLDMSCDADGNITKNYE